MAYVDSLTVSIPILAASNTALTRYGVVPSILTGEYELVGADLVNNVAITADATDYRTITLNGVDGSTAQAARVTDVAGGNLAAGAVEALTLAGGANAIFTPGDAIEVVCTEAGTGPACDFSVVCHLVKRR
jgi:hypothetical protein